MNENYDDALPILTQLLVGTLKLEETDLAVEPELASELLPLWQMARSLSDSDTAAEAEVTAITKQIQQAMTNEQIGAIANMQVTQAGLMEMLGDLGFGFAGRGQEMSPDERATALAQRGIDPNIMAGRGGPGSGGQGRGGFGENLSPEERDRLLAERGGRAGTRIPASLLDAVIKLLEAKVA